MSSDSADTCDVLVVGGGINGAGIARDLAGRGLSVLLVEQHDLAQHTSSSSTKLIHGGLRYLEHYEFSLVRKALAEREGLLRSAPHIMWPLRFVMPHDASMRPVWMIRAGLFLYDHLARRELLPASRTLDLRRDAAGVPLKRQFTKGFEYSDGWVDDARLVVLNAVDAAERGARIATRCRCERAEAAGGRWQAQLVDARGRARRVVARAIVNAAGPWAAEFLQARAGRRGAKSLRLVKGSHIVVPRLFDHDRAYIFQNPDRRIIFAIPYEGRYTLIGTTDVEHTAAPGTATVDAGEVDYLCEQASRYFERPVRPDDVVWRYCGVRPLLEDEAADAQAVTRDYTLELDDAAGAPLLSVWGGKITTFRKLAEEAADRLCAALNARNVAWTADAVLPGGDLSAWIGPPQRPDTDIARFDDAVARQHPQWPDAMRKRWVRSYGSRLARIAERALGPEVGPGLHEAELRYLHDDEWARSADDVLWRRTKLGLHFDAAARERVAQWWQHAYPGSDAAASPAAQEAAWN